MPFLRNMIILISVVIADNIKTFHQRSVYINSRSRRCNIILYKYILYYILFSPVVKTHYFLSNGLPITNNNDGKKIRQVHCRSFSYNLNYFSS